MRNYSVKAINVGGFDLGEADRVLTIFSAERGILKAIAKGARKPGAKMSGRSDFLCVNELLLASGRTFEVITQAQTIENFSAIRSNLESLTYALYYAELTASFGAGLEDEAEEYFQFLFDSLKLLAEASSEQLSLCLEFEMGLLDFLGYKPELTFCIVCRVPLDDFRLGKFNVEHGGIVCSACLQKSRRLAVNETSEFELQQEHRELSQGIHITPLVWKTLILRSERNLTPVSAMGSSSTSEQVRKASQRILQAYIEHRASRRFNSLDLLSQMQTGLRFQKK